MLVEKKFLAASDVTMRLKHGIVKWRDNYWWSEDWAGLSGNNDTRFLLHKLPYIDIDKWNSQVVILDANDPELDTRSPDLGYINWCSRVLYIFRPPYRKQKQVSGTENLLYRAPDAESRKITVDLILSSAFHSMLRNDYPLAETCLKGCKDGLEGCSHAFSREFAFVKPGKRDIRLAMHGEFIGDVTNEGLIHLDDYNKSSFITMALIEYGVVVG